MQVAPALTWQSGLAQLQQHLQDGNLLPILLDTLQGILQGCDVLGQGCQLLPLLCPG